MAEHPLWHCPKCGARLVSRNLWHSCGRFTLEAVCSGPRLGFSRPRKDHFIAGFALHRWLTNRRIIKTVDYGPRWRGHYVRITSAADLDDELRAWLQESHDVVGMRSDLAERRLGRAKSRRPR